MRAALETSIRTRHKQNKKPRTATRYSALTSFLFTRCVRVRFVSDKSIKYLTCSVHRVNRCFAARGVRFIFFFLSSSLALCLSHPARIRVLSYLYTTQWRNGLTLKSHMSLVTAATRRAITCGRVIFKLAVHWRRDQSSNLNFRFPRRRVGARKKLRL